MQKKNNSGQAKGTNFQSTDGTTVQPTSGYDFAIKGHGNAIHG